MTQATSRGKHITHAAIGSIAGALLALGAGVPAFAVSAPEAPVDESVSAAPQSRAAAAETAPTFTPDLQTEIFIGDEIRPTDFVSSPDGRWGYVVASETPEFFIIDMASREVVNKIAFEGTGGEYIRVSPDGTRAYFAITEGYYSQEIGVIDLVSQQFVTSYTGIPDHVQDVVVSSDGSAVYTVTLHGHVVRIDIATGELIQNPEPLGDNAHGLVLIHGDSTVLVGHENKIHTLDAATLTLASSVALPNVSSATSLRVDTDESRVYFADSSGTTLGVFNPETGEITARAAVGSPMHEVVGFDSMNRAFGDVPYWDMIMAADFNTGKRSESFRATPTAPFSLSVNPVTGELLSANAGWSNATRGSTVTIINTPSATDPAEIEIDEVGEQVRFETVATGIKRGHGGGVQWQASTDGENWADIEGAVFEQLDVATTEENIDTLYRVSWYDDFWGQRGVTTATKVLHETPTEPELPEQPEIEQPTPEVPDTSAEQNAQQVDAKGHLSQTGGAGPIALAAAAAIALAAGTAALLARRSARRQ